MQEKPKHTPVYPDLQEPDLIRLAQQGNSSAFGDVFEMHRQEFYRIAARTVKPDDAEDITQEAALRAFTNIPNFEDRNGTMAPFLNRIVNNLITDYKRSKYRKSSPYDTTVERTDESIFETGDNPYETPEEHLFRQDSLRRVEAALPKLSPKLAELIRAVYVNDMPLKDYAAAIGLNPETAKDRHRRAKAALKKLIESGEVDLG